MYMVVEKSNAIVTEAQTGRRRRVRRRAESAGYRLFREWDIPTLARLTRYAPRYLREVESGRIHPSERLRFTIAKVTGIPEAELFVVGEGSGVRNGKGGAP